MKRSIAGTDPFCRSLHGETVARMVILNGGGPGVLRDHCEVCAEPMWSTQVNPLLRASNGSLKSRSSRFEICDTKITKPYLSRTPCPAAARDGASMPNGLTTPRLDSYPALGHAKVTSAQQKRSRSCHFVRSLNGRPLNGRVSPKGARSVRADILRFGCRTSRPLRRQSCRD